MERNEIKDFIKKNFKEDKFISLYSIIRSKFKDVDKSIIENTSYLVNKRVTFNERLYNILNDLDEIQRCKMCDKEVRFVNFKLGYNKYCSSKCSFKDPQRIENIKNTVLERYGVSNPLKNKEIRQKMNNTIRERYGVDNISQLDKIKEIKKNKSIEKYGVECPFQSEEVKDKIKETTLNRYGVDNVAKLDEIQEKKCVSNLEKYGKEHVFQVKSIRDKGKITNLEKYGNEFFTKTDTWLEKTKQTNLNNFGVEFPAKSQDVKDMCKGIFLEKYGVDSPMKNSEVKKKCISKLKERFLSKLDKMLNFLKLEIDGEEYISNSFKHSWKCKECNKSFIQTWSEIQQGYKCPTCYPRSVSSASEKEIAEFVKGIINIEVIENDRTLISPLELDIYIPSKNIAIEFDGIYWHSERMLKDSNYHLNKTKLCEDKGIRLIHIFEDEWIFKKDIVKTRLAHILGASNNERIHARKCKIKQISSGDSNDFLNRFHIQGDDNSPIRLGAFFKNELVSVMTFSHGNIAKGSKTEEGVWELNRFCIDYRYNIPGIASKIFNYFKKNFEWEEIFSYADRRWSIGELYNKLGFEMVRFTSPNYWYIKDFIRKHRFGLRKRVDEPKEIPEYILRLNEGYHRIWDCGSYKFKINRHILEQI